MFQKYSSAEAPGTRYPVPQRKEKKEGNPGVSHLLYMEKRTIVDISNDLKAKRDALSLAHEQLKRDNDDWNKCIIVLSLATGMFESMKIKMGWDSNVVALVPIMLSSIIASISALIKFKKFPEQMEVLLQSQSLLTHTLNKTRNESEITPQIRKDYNDALEQLETSVYPDIRRRYLKISHNNLISIMKQEQKFFDSIDKVNAHKATEDESISSDSSNPLSIDKSSEV